MRKKIIVSIFILFILIVLKTTVLAIGQSFTIKKGGLQGIGVDSMPKTKSGYTCDTISDYTVSKNGIVTVTISEGKKAIVKGISKGTVTITIKGSGSGWVSNPIYTYGGYMTTENTQQTFTVTVEEEKQTTTANTSNGYTMTKSVSLALEGNKGTTIAIETTEKPIGMNTAAQQAAKNLKDCRVSWESSDAEIVGVTGTSIYSKTVKGVNYETCGEITAKKAGKVTITATIREKSDNPMLPLGGKILATLKTEVTVTEKVTSKTDFSAKSSEDSGDKKSFVSTSVKPSVTESEREDVFKLDVIQGGADKYKPADDSTGATEIENATSKILTVISNIGIVVAVISLAVLGVKYMMGSIEERAEYKEGLVPYVVGAFLLFGITTIVRILIAIGEKIGSV